MLNQIIVTRSFAPCRCHQFAHGIELMIARKNHRLGDDPFLSAFAIIDLFLLLLDEHEMAEDIEKTVALQNLFPEIAAAIARGMLRISRATLRFARMTSTIKREK